MGKIPKDSGKKYTKEEIECYFGYRKEHNKFETYDDAIDYKEYHKNITGKDRSYHALYMFGWRCEEGKYNHIIKNEFNKKDKK